MKRGKFVSVLGIDPGTVVTGWVIVHQNSSIHLRSSGILKATVKGGIEDRRHQLREMVTNKIPQAEGFESVDLVAIEDPYAMPRSSMGSLKSLYKIKTMIEEIAYTSWRLPYIEVTPSGGWHNLVREYSTPEMIESSRQFKKNGRRVDMKLLARKAFREVTGTQVDDDAQDMVDAFWVAMYAMGNAVVR